MGTISRRELELFWRDLGQWLSQCRRDIELTRDGMQGTSLQILEQLVRDADRHALDWTLAAAAAPVLGQMVMPPPAALIDFARRCDAWLHDDARLTESQAQFARRLYAMHQFLEGQPWGTHFGALLLDGDDDLKLGIGIGLKDGTMLRFFSRLLTPCEDNPIRRCFEDDAEAIIDAVQGGQTQLERYFDAQRILRYDPALSRTVSGFSDAMTSRFGRLAAEPEARHAQIDLVAGKSFARSKQKARHIGIASLRGFAMIFDLDPTHHAFDADEIASRRGEAHKCMSLADAVISKMHGHVAAHWQNRLDLIFHGSGCIDGRYYDEKRFLGEDAAHQNWDDDHLSFEEDAMGAEPEPGHFYLVCPGDKLSQLTSRAYHGAGDYRRVLRQNPHITRPDRLEAGTRIYFPPLDGHEVATQTVQCLDDGLVLRCAGRLITLISPMTASQKAQFIAALSSLSRSELWHAMAVRFPVGCGILCAKKTILMSLEDNARELAMIFPDAADRDWTWMCHLAAEIRGDIALENGVFLPLAAREKDARRRAWMTSALHRILHDASTRPIAIAIHPAERCVDLIESNGQVVLRLENDDFMAIHAQIHRRLDDFIAPPVVQMEAMACLWVSDVFSMGEEIAVPPLRHANPYAMLQPDGSAQCLVPMGTPIYPLMRGTVVECGRVPGQGFVVVIRHANHLLCRLSSLATVCVQPGQSVEADTMIARSGCGEFSDQPMIVVEIRKKDDEQEAGEIVNYYEIVGHLWPNASSIHVEIGD